MTAKKQSQGDKMNEKNIKDYLRWCIKIQQCKYCNKHEQCPIKDIKDKLIKEYFIHIDINRKAR